MTTKRRDINNRAWLYGYELAQTSQTTKATIKAAEAAGLIASINPDRLPHQHARFPVGAVLAIADYKKRWGRFWFSRARRAEAERAFDGFRQSERAAADSTTQGDLGEVLRLFEETAAQEPAQEPAADDVTLMLYGLDERLQAIHATLGDLVAAVNRCAAAWEK